MTRLTAGHDRHPSVAQLCALFGKTRQAYYVKRKNEQEKGEAQSMQEAVVVDYVLDVRKKDPGIGAKKLWIMFSANLPGGSGIGRDAFFDILHAHGLMTRMRKRSTRTTFSNHGIPTFPDLRKAFIPSAVNQLWVNDITYVQVKSGKDSVFAYISFCTDAYSREILGYKLSRTLEAKYPIEALKMGMKRIAGIPKADLNLIHHSDRGTQYASTEYVSILKEAGIRISMTESGDPHDNPQAERINGTVKNELLGGDTSLTFEELEKLLPSKVDFYNNSRPHMSLNYMTPSQAAEHTGPIEMAWTSYRSLAIARAQEEPKDVG